MGQHKGLIPTKAGVFQQAVRLQRLLLQFIKMRQRIFRHGLHIAEIAVVVIGSIHTGGNVT
ncbi:hypothetical protein D3C73_1591930 [compost metagenome]